MTFSNNILYNCDTKFYQVKRGLLTLVGNQKTTTNNKVRAIQVKHQVITICNN